MNITPWDVYWVTRLSYVSGTLFFVTLILFLVSLALLVLGFCWRATVKEYSWETDESVKQKIELGEKIHSILCKIVAPITLGMALLTTLVPCSHEAAAIIIIPKIANSEKVEKVGNAIYDLAVQWMDELKPRKAKKNERR